MSPADVVMRIPADEIVCSRCGALVPYYAYYEGTHDRDACREMRGLVPCDDPACKAMEAPSTLAEYMLACDHWRNHSRMHGCSHGN